MLDRRGERAGREEPWEAAEARLAVRAQRREAVEGRRERRRRAAPWVGLVLGAAAAAAGFLWVLEHAGGDLAAWSGGAALALVVAVMVLPALVASVLARRAGWGWGETSLLAVAAAALAVALAAGVGLVALGLGPA